MARKKKNDLPFDQSPIDKVVCSEVYNNYDIQRRNQDEDISDFEASLDMLECKRTERDYEWMSDVFIPEYPSIHLTEASQWASQYFQTRDFVEVYLEDGEEKNVERATATKKLINNLLNIREVFHYQKYMRARSINSIKGDVVIVGWWDRSDKQIKTGEKPKRISQISAETGMMEFKDIMEPVMENVPVIDNFNYEVIDPRNVFTDNTYCYSLQQKEWVIIRSEMSYEQLKAKEKQNAYINLDQIKAIASSAKTQTAKDTYEKEKPSNKFESGVVYFDTLERWGKTWAIVTESDKEGNPVKAEPGYAEDGSIIDEASLIEGIVTIAVHDSIKVLIRFQPTPFRDARGSTYRPLVRGLCYVHPTKDVGMSSGKYDRELQVALNDTVNMSNDRVKLATFPTMKVRRYALQDNDSIYFEPEHPIVVENIDDIQEFIIKDDVRGAMSQASLFIDKMQQVEAVYPNTMGRLPNAASTTATAITESGAQSNLRSNYKSLTFEYTFLIEFYWMILQMTYQFMHPKTAWKVMGENAPVFDPNSDYTYKPVTGSIELEFNKERKVKMYDQILGRIANVPNPAIVPIISYIVGRQCILLGDEFQNIEKLLKNLSQTPNTPDKAEMGQNPGQPKGAPVSNQRGIQMGPQEMSARRM
jgi:hypothetical protein